MTHTPTPWIARLNGDCSCIRASDNDLVTLGDHDTGLCMTEDDASLIVRAVNAHDALVEALELQDMAAREIHGKSYVNTDTQRKTVAALKLARGETNK